MRGCGACSHKAWDLRCERGGGKKAEAPTFAQPPPPQIIQSPTPPPNVAESSKQLFESQLQYNPQLAAQAFQLQQQYGFPSAQQQVQTQTQLAPQLAQSEYDLQAKYGPMYRALYENLFPSQVQGQELLAQQALQRLQSPYSLTPEQQSAQEAIRGRAQDRLVQSIRESANVGGTLYGGRRQQREDEAVSQLSQEFAAQDIQQQQAARDQALRELIASGQVVFPQVQQPGVPGGQVAQFGQSVTPSPDALMQAILAAQSNFIVNPAVYRPGNPGTPGYFGSFANAFAGR